MWLKYSKVQILSRLGTYLGTRYVPILGCISQVLSTKRFEYHIYTIEPFSGFLNLENLTAKQAWGIADRKAEEERKTSVTKKKR